MQIANLPLGSRLGLIRGIAESISYTLGLNQSSKGSDKMPFQVTPIFHKTSEIQAGATRRSV